MMYQRDDWTLFRNLATLGQKAGVPREKLAALVLKELTDNALDTGGNVKVGMSMVPVGAQEDDEVALFYVEDDGPGIAGADSTIASLFSFNRPLTSTKLVRLPTRGALGNGLRVVAGAVLASGGQLRVRTKGRSLRLEPQDDGTTRAVWLGLAEGTTGTRVEVVLGPELIADEAAARRALWMAELAVRLRGESRYEGQTSAYWYDGDSFFEMLQASNMKTGAILELFDRGNRALTSPLMMTFPARTDEYTREQANELLLVLRTKSTPVKPAKLGVVGEEAFEADGYSRKVGTFTLRSGRSDLHAEVPVVIEVWARRLEPEARPRAQLYVNRTPISATTNAGARGGRHPETYITGCGLNHYFRTGKAPMELHCCVTAPYMPIATDGKEPNLSALVELVAEAIKSATGKARRATAASKGVSKKDAIFAVMNEGIRAASDKGRHRFSIRQLYYAVRPLLQERGVEEPDYTYFGSVVGDYETSIGKDVPGMYRDARGILYHPHTHEQISLGTLNVEKYRRPEYRFNKVLYIEKGGFFPALIDAKWPERHDCALLTSQGFASRAARDVIDLLGDGAEELQFFCIHDADGPGTLIFEALVEGTRARPGRRVKVENLGLEPWEAMAMGLPSEKVKRVRGRVPVAQYVRDRLRHRDKRASGERIDWEDWEEWLQTGRYELNAMMTSDLLRWLDGKMRNVTGGKVVPPESVLAARLHAATRDEIRSRLIAQAVAELDIERRASELAEPALAGTEDGIASRVRSDLRRQPHESWEEPLKRQAMEAADRAIAPAKCELQATCYLFDEGPERKACEKNCRMKRKDKAAASRSPVPSTLERDALASLRRRTRQNPAYGAEDYCAWGRGDTNAPRSGACGLCPGCLDGEAGLEDYDRAEKAAAEMSRVLERMKTGEAKAFEGLLAAPFLATELAELRTRLPAGRRLRLFVGERYLCHGTVRSVGADRNVTIRGDDALTYYRHVLPMPAGAGPDDDPEIDGVVLERVGALR